MENGFYYEQKVIKSRVRGYHTYISVLYIRTMTEISNKDMQHVPFLKSMCNMGFTCRAPEQSLNIHQGSGSTEGKAFVIKVSPHGLE